MVRQHRRRRSRDEIRLVNSEDGVLYRWNLTTNTFSPEYPPRSRRVFEAYTPTAIGPDGAVYAINNARLYSVIARLAASDHGHAGEVHVNWDSTATGWRLQSSLDLTTWDYLTGILAGAGSLTTLRRTSQRSSTACGSRD
jgi:hypothetical protein